MKYKTLEEIKADKQISPEDVAQFSLYENDLNDNAKFTAICDLVVCCEKSQTDPLKQLIVELKKQNSELEALQKSDEKHIASLEKQIKQYEEIVDKHIISSANYTAEYINKVISENSDLRQALEEIKRHSFPGNDMYKLAEQALKP